MRNRRIAAALACVVVCLLAVSAAFAVSITGPNTVRPGDTIGVTISGSGRGTSATISTSGLEYVSASGGLTPDAGHVILLADMGAMSAKYTYRVTANSGVVSVTLSNVVIVNDDMEEVPGSGASWSATVTASDPEPVTSEPGSVTTEPAPVTSEPGSVTTEPAPVTSEPGSVTTEPAPVTSDPGTVTNEPVPDETKTRQPNGVGNQTTRPRSSANPAGTPEPSKDGIPKTADVSAGAFWVLTVAAAGCVALALVAVRKIREARR